MASKTLPILKVVLWIVSLFHLIVGASLNLPLGLKESVGSGIYGAQVDWTAAQFVYILKPLGAFMFALGIMAAIAATNPIKNRAIIYGFAVLFVFRGLQRIVFEQEILSTFAIEPGRQVNAIFFMFFSAVLLVVLDYLSNRAN
ncbi:MAG: hypothetical protein AAF629_07365 [Chloroflexota bacterium]